MKSQRKTTPQKGPDDAGYLADLNSSDSGSDDSDLSESATVQKAKKVPAKKALPKRRESMLYDGITQDGKIKVIGDDQQFTGIGSIYKRKTKKQSTDGPADLLVHVHTSSGVRTSSAIEEHIPCAGSCTGEAYVFVGFFEQAF